MTGMSGIDAIQSHLFLSPEGSLMSKFVCTLATAVLFFMLQVAGRGGDPDRAKELVAKAIKASGGEAKLASLKAGACKAKGTIQQNGVQLTAKLDVVWQGLDQYRITVALDFNGQTSNALMVINGDKGWAKNLDQDKVDEASKDDLPEIKATLYALRMPLLLPALLDKAVKLSPLAEIEIDGRAALGVTVAHKGRKDVNLFFDKETGLPAKSELRIADRKDKKKTIAFLYRDYKENNGLKHPTRILVKADEAEVDIVLELSELKAQAKVNAAVFAAPE